MGVNAPSNWFTPLRVRRLADVLRCVPGSSPGMGRRDIVHAAWKVCGGPFEEIEEHLRILVSLDLVRGHDDPCIRTTAGNRVLRALRRDDPTELAITLIRAGVFHDQARMLIENGEIGVQADLICAKRTAIGCAPQLVALLSLWNEVAVSPRLVVPKRLLAELDTVWSLLPPQPVMPSSALERKSVGDRAEMYTVQFERSRASIRSAVAWVARDSDSLGYDVEDRSSSPPRCIEVKGRRDREEILFLSGNEMDKALALSGRYEIHFWGAIDLTRDPQTEFAALRAEGYPLVVKDIASAVAQGMWIATPTEWRLERKKTSADTSSS